MIFHSDRDGFLGRKPAEERLQRTERSWWRQLLAGLGESLAIILGLIFALVGFHLFMTRFFG